MKKINRILVSSIAILSLLLAANYLLPVSRVLADAKGDACNGLPNATVDANGNCVVPNSPSVDNIVHTVINILSIVVGIIAIFMIILGGIRFVMSSGDSNAASSARNTIIYAVVGLVVVFLAQVIVNYVLLRLNKSAAP